MDSETRRTVTKNEHNKDEKLNSISIEELNNRINKSEEDFKKGRYKTTSELFEKYKL